jgi:hypothetical protein
MDFTSLLHLGPSNCLPSSRPRKSLAPSFDVVVHQVVLPCALLQAQSSHIVVAASARFSSKMTRSIGKMMFYPHTILLRFVKWSHFDIIWVKHWEYKSWIKF